MFSFKGLKIAALAGLALGALSLPATAKDVIGASLLTQSHPFYIDLGEAMKKEAEKQGVTLDISIANQDLNKQLADIEDFITKKVDVIVLSPVDSDGVRNIIRKAEKANIKVITVDIPANGVKVASHIGTDNYAGGVKAGEMMAKLTDGKGEIAVINYPTVQSVVDRVKGFSKALEAHKDMKIVANQAGITRAEALATAENILKANPKIVGIFGFGDDAALAAAAAVKAAKLENQVKVIGFDGMKEARDAVDSDPVFAAVVRQYPDKMGQTAVQSAVKIMKGETVPELQPIVPGMYVRGGDVKE
ncbi:substrate-binding domain-containing protein [Microvirga sp. W0021]|uniref:Substrate-binding domain-containing protein n=1 Tax=Hohaiivirga grylli TaxID=3133970 RepID=A0ABV0BIV2_9HYPH